MSDVAPLCPPAPTGVPANLAKSGLRYRLQAAIALSTLLLFLSFYFVLATAAFGLTISAGLLFVASIIASTSTGWEHALLVALWLSLAVMGAMLFVFFIKAFFKRGKPTDDLEITEPSQPELFRFIGSVCREIDCPVPPRVYLSHEVNAAVRYRTSILNLFVQPQKDLLIGLGLVNGVNLVEFKALLAHELGHFSQRTLRLDGYIWVVYDVIFNMLNARDRWDYWVIRGFDTPWISVFAFPLYAMIEVTRSLLRGLFRLLRPVHLSLRRQMEFHADLVAVSVTGSDAPVHLLLKCNFLQNCLQKAIEDLSLAAEQRLYSRDLFAHQLWASEALRAEAKNPNVGCPPELAVGSDRPPDLFQPGDENIATVWSDHPSDFDREQNAKRRYVRSPVDNRSAWLLFRDPETLREQVTRRFYQSRSDLGDDDSLADPKRVQEFINNENAAARLDPKYQALYADRYLEIYDIDQLIADAGSRPDWPPAQLAMAQMALRSEEFRSWTGAFERRRGECRMLENLNVGPDEVGQFEFRGQQYPLTHRERCLEAVRSELKSDFKRLETVDRDVFLLHEQLARGQNMQEEYHQRYRFHNQVQQLHAAIWRDMGQMDAALASMSGGKTLSNEQAGWLLAALRELRGDLEEILNRAAHLRTPALEHMTAGEPLLRYLPSEPLPPDAKTFDTAFDAEWIRSLRRHMEAVFYKLNRIQYKSLAQILALQERLGESLTRVEASAGSGGA